jgi:hypothetical protein
MTNLDLINWTLEEAARVRTERGDAGNPERKRPLDKLLAELEREPADLSKPAAALAPHDSIVFVEPAQNAASAEILADREQTRAKIDRAADIETAGNERLAAAERFAALERRYAAHLAISTRAPPDISAHAPPPAPAPPPAENAAPMPALLRAIVEPNIHTARADRARAVDLRWVVRDIRNKRLKNAPEVRNDLGVLIEFGLVEMEQDQPILTKAGLKAIV